MSDERAVRPIGSDERAVRPGVPSRRLLLLLVCLALAVAAGALEGAARLAWFTGDVEAVGRGMPSGPV
jgi:hypothetical protein